MLGVQGLDNDDYLGKVGEYDASRQGARPTAATDFWIQNGSTYVEATGEWLGDAHDQNYGVDIQMGRYFRISSHFLQYLHRLDHDPLTDLDAAKGGPMVWSEDAAAGVQYQPSYNELETEMEFTVPGATWLKFRAAHKTVQRGGRCSGALDVEVLFLSRAVGNEGN